MMDLRRVSTAKEIYRFEYVPSKSAVGGNCGLSVLFGTCFHGSAVPSFKFYGFIV